MISLDATVTFNDMNLEDAGFVTVETVESMIDNLEILDEDAVIDHVQEYVDTHEFMTQCDLEDAISEAYEEMDNRIEELEQDGAAMEYRVLRNQMDIARRAISLLLEERERSLKQRAKRLFTLTGNTMRKLVRRVHWHMPRR